MKPAVCIVILNWNGWQDTVECIESCLRLTYPRFSILLIDNGSSDGSEQALRVSFPQIELIQTGVNLGFAGGCNVGIRRSLQDGADYVWLLNNDTKVEPGALGSLVEVLESEPSAGLDL